MKRSIVAAHAVALFSLSVFASSPALADDPPAPPAAFKEPSPAPDAPDADRDRDKDRDRDRERDRDEDRDRDHESARTRERDRDDDRESRDDTGITFDIRQSVLVPAGQFVNNLDMSTFGPGSATSIALGFHFDPHLGVLVGLRGSFGHQGFDQCDTGCSGYSLQVPLMLEYDAVNRTRGFYLKGGLGLLTSYHASAPGASYSASNDIAELKTEIGWRIPMSRGKGRATLYGFEIFAGGDFGEFQNVSVTLGDSTASGSVTSPVWHYVFELGVGVHFSP